MRQLSLTETETFVNLAKHALETLHASDDDDVKDGGNHRYSDDPNNDDNDDTVVVDNTSAVPMYPPSCLKVIQSEPVFKRRGKKALRLLGGMEETGEEAIEMAECGSWMRRASGPEAGDIDEDVLQFVARSTSDVEDDAPSGDETTQLANATNLLLC